jgi:hypothetical protein
MSIASRTYESKQNIHELQLSAAKGCHLCYLRWEHLCDMTSESERLAIRGVSYRGTCWEKPLQFWVDFSYYFGNDEKKSSFFFEKKCSLKNKSELGLFKRLSCTDILDRAMHSIDKLQYKNQDTRSTDITAENLKSALELVQSWIQQCTE